MAYSVCIEVNRNRNNHLHEGDICQIQRIEGVKELVYVYACVLCTHIIQCMACTTRVEMCEWKVSRELDECLE